MRGGDMLARVGPVRAIALADQIAGAVWEQADPGCREGILNVGGHFTGQQLRREDGAVRQHVQHFLPLLVAQRAHADGHQVGFGARTLHARRHAVLDFFHREHLAFTRVIAAAIQASHRHQPFHRLDPAPRPPVFGKCAALTARLDAAARLARVHAPAIAVSLAVTAVAILPGAAVFPTVAGFPAVAVGSLLRHAYSWRLSATRSFNSSVESSVSHCSPPPMMASANPFFDSIISSMRSSSVPVVMNLCTCTFCACPMR